LSRFAAPASFPRQQRPVLHRPVTPPFAEGASQGNLSRPARVSADEVPLDRVVVFGATRKGVVLHGIPGEIANKVVAVVLPLPWPPALKAIRLSGGNSDNRRAYNQSMNAPDGANVATLQR